MTQKPEYVLVRESSARWTIMRLNSIKTCYVPLAVCSNENDGEHVLLGLLESKEFHRG